MKRELCVDGAKLTGVEDAADSESETLLPNAMFDTEKQTGNMDKPSEEAFAANSACNIERSTDEKFDELELKEDEKKWLVPAIEKDDAEPKIRMKLKSEEKILCAMMQLKVKEATERITRVLTIAALLNKLDKLWQRKVLVFDPGDEVSSVSMRISKENILVMQNL